VSRALSAMRFLLRMPEPPHASSRHRHVTAVLVLRGEARRSKCSAIETLRGRKDSARTLTTLDRRMLASGMEDASCCVALRRCTNTSGWGMS